MKQLDKISSYVSEIKKRGRIVFSYAEITENFPKLSRSATKSALNRLVKKEQILSAWKGFYLIISSEYALRGIVPPELYIDDLMKFLGRSYYIGLLSAASFYGSAHQQPQQFFVVNTFPALRDTTKKDLCINFITTRKKIPDILLHNFKTRTGYIQVSSAELTVADLITHSKEVGGFNRAITTINDLVESLNFNKITADFFEYVPLATIQRLGYLFDNIIELPKLANILWNKTQKFGHKFQTIPLRRGKKSLNSPIDDKWKIIINEQLQLDE